MRELYWNISSFSNFVGAVGLLLIFKDFKFKSRIVNGVAATTFGIFLIHENPYVRGWIYKFLRQDMVPVGQFQHLNVLLLDGNSIYSRNDY